MDDNKLLQVDRLKREVIAFGSAQQLKTIEQLALHIGDCLVRVTHRVHNLGVQFDADMTLESHVTAVYTSAIVHLHNISRIRRYLIE